MLQIHSNCYGLFGRVILDLLSFRIDCVSLLESCLLENSQEASEHAEKICMALMPNPDQSDCIRSSKYVEPTMRSLQQLGDFHISH